MLAYGQAYTLSYTLLHLSEKFTAATGTYGSAYLTQNQVAARSCWFESGQGHQPTRRHSCEATHAALQIGFVLFADLTQLDLTGPLQVLARLPDSAVHIAAKSDAPVPSDCGLSLVPTQTFAS